MRRTPNRVRVYCRPGRICRESMNSASVAAHCRPAMPYCVFGDWAAGHRLDHGQPKRLGPIDQQHESQGLAEKFALLLLIDFTDEFCARSSEQRSDLVAEVNLVHSIHFSGDFKRDAQRLRYLDRALDPLLRGYALEEGQIATARIERRPGRRLVEKKVQRLTRCTVPPLIG